MLGTEQLGGQSSAEVDVDAYEQQLRAKLAVSGLSVLRYGLRFAARTEELSDRVAEYYDRDRLPPVAPDLPEYHGWLKQATALRAKHESEGLEGPVATDRDIIAILARVEPLAEEAGRFYND